MGVLSAKYLSIIEWFSHDNVDTPDLTHWIKVQTCKMAIIKEVIQAGACSNVLQVLIQN